MGALLGYWFFQTEGSSEDSNKVKLGPTGSSTWIPAACYAASFVSEIARVALSLIMQRNDGVPMVPTWVARK